MYSYGLFFKIMSKNFYHHINQKNKILFNISTADAWPFPGKNHLIPRIIDLFYDGFELHITNSYQACPLGLSSFTHYSVSNIMHILLYSSHLYFWLLCDFTYNKFTLIYVKELI